MPARLQRTRIRSHRHLSGFRKTRQAIFEILEYKHLMAIDSIIGVDPSRTLDLPSDYSSAESAALRSDLTEAQNRAMRIADSFIPGSGDPNAPYSSQLMQVGMPLINQALWMWVLRIKPRGRIGPMRSALMVRTWRRKALY